MFKLGLFSLLIFAFNSQAYHIGLKELILNDEKSQRPLSIHLVYPTNSDSNNSLFADNAKFIGFEAIPDAKPDAKIHPLLVISHGYGGNWRNLSWIAQAMAHQNYIVALVEHPGTTTFNLDPIQAKQLWQRPIDLSRTITYLENNPGIAGQVDLTKITLLGHSLGGWTVMAAAGAQFNAIQFLDDCNLNSSLSDVVCGLKNKLGITAENQPKFNFIADPRVSFVISLDIGLARGFTSNSLNNFAIPTLIIGAGVDIGDLPVEMESGYLAQALPKNLTTFIVLDQATHFSFMQQCQSKVTSPLKPDHKDNEIICLDGLNIKRSQLHAMILKSINQFLTVQ